MDVISIMCGGCGGSVAVAEEQRGQPVRCRECQTEVTPLPGDPPTPRTGVIIPLPSPPPLSGDAPTPRTGVIIPLPSSPPALSGDPPTPRTGAIVPLPSPPPPSPAPATSPAPSGKLPAVRRGPSSARLRAVAGPAAAPPPARRGPAPALVAVLGAGAVGLLVGVIVVLATRQAPSQGAAVATSEPATDTRPGGRAPAPPAPPGDRRPAPPAEEPLDGPWRRELQDVLASVALLPDEEAERAAEIRALRDRLARLELEAPDVARLAIVEARDRLSEAERAPARPPRRERPVEPPPRTRGPAPAPREEDAPSAPAQPPAPAPSAGSRRPAPAPVQPEAGASRERAVAVDLDRLDVLYALYEAHWKKDLKTARALLSRLEAAGPGPELSGGRGFVHFLAGRFREAYDDLTAAGEVTLQAVHDRALAALYLGRFDEVRGLLDHEAFQGSATGHRVRTVLDGPFRARYPLAADALEARSEGGHYRVVTDLGLARADLDALERKLATADDAQRAELIDKARKRHRGLSELCAVMEKAYKAYDKLFGIERASEVVPTVFVFSDRAQFDEFSSRLDSSGSESMLGYYWSPYRILVFYDQGGGQERGGVVSQATLEVLLHETFHQWLDLYVPEAPRWFDEGLAEYFGIAQLTRTELRYGLVPESHPSRLDNIRMALNGEMPRPWPLERLVTADYEAFMDPSQAATNYAHAWSFVHFLGSSSGGQKALREYFHALREGVDLETARDRAFKGSDLSALEREWRAYVGKLR